MVKIDTIIIKNSQIDSNNNYKKCIEKLNEDLNYLSGLEGYLPTKKISEKFPNIKAESRDITAKILLGGRGLGYIVTDKATPKNEDIPMPIRTKGYVSKNSEEMRELKDNNEQKILFDSLGINIGSDLIEN